MRQVPQGKSSWENKTFYIQKVNNLCVEKGYLSMLTYSNVSSLACVFYRPEHNAKEGTPWNWILKMKRWHIPTDRSQRVDEKNWVFCVVIIFTHKVMFIKMSKVAYFWWKWKISYILDKIFKCNWKTLFSSFIKPYEWLGSSYR